MSATASGGPARRRAGPAGSATPLLERVALTASKVDREKRVIVGVKVLGLTSANGRRYTLEAVKKAAALYEKVQVFKGHPKKATDSREADELFGWLENVEVRDDGLYGDLHYFESDDLAEKVCEAAERNSKALGLSHNADGVGGYQDGVYVVTEITEVRSVDVVTAPATNGGLFEEKGHPMPKVKKKAFLEAALKGLDATKAVKARLRKLLEADAIPADAEMAVDPAAAADDAAPEDALKAGFLDAIMQAVKAALDGDGAALKKVQDLIKSHAKVNPGAPAEEEEEPPADDDEEPVEEDEDEEEKDGAKTESKKLKSKLAFLERKDKVRDLCEEANVTPDKVLLEALLSAKDEAAVKRLIEREKKASPRKGGPKSSAPGRPITESRDDAPKTDDAEALGRWVKAGWVKAG